MFTAKEAQEAKEVRNFFKNPTKGDEDYYQLFDIPRNATTNEVRSAFNRLALIHHPDKVVDDTKKEQANAIFDQLTAMRDTLVDESERRGYDSTLPAVGSPRVPLELSSTEKEFYSLCRSVLKAINPYKENIPIQREERSGTGRGFSYKIGGSVYDPYVNLNKIEQQHFIAIVRLIETALQPPEMQEQGGSTGKVIVAYKRIEETLYTEVMRWDIDGNSKKEICAVHYSSQSADNFVEVTKDKKDAVAELLSQCQNAIKLITRFNKENPLLKSAINVEDGKVIIQFSQNRGTKGLLEDVNQAYARFVEEYRETQKVKVLRSYQEWSLEAAMQTFGQQKLLPNAEQKTITVNQAVAEVKTIDKSLKVKNHYEALKIPRDATPEQIKTAFDRKSNIERFLKKQTKHGTEQGMKKYWHWRQAYETLKDPAKKQEYDKNLSPGAPQPKR